MSKDIGRKRKNICCETAANSFSSLLMRYARYDKTVPIFIVPIVTVLSDFLMTVVTVMTVVTLEMHIYIPVIKCHRVTGVIFKNKKSRDHTHRVRL